MDDDDFEIPEGMVAHEVLGMRMVFPEGMPYEFAVAVAEAMVQAGAMELVDGKLQASGNCPEGELQALDMTISDDFQVQKAQRVEMDDAELTPEERAALEAKVEAMGLRKKTRH